MRKFNWNVLLFAALLLVTTACEKDVLQPDIAEPERAFDINYLRGGTRPTISFAAGPTELGADRVNPYTVSNIEAAYLEVDLAIVDLDATHQYIKFKPEDAADMELLDDADLLLLDFSWTREVIKQGDYYHSPRNDEDFPELYTVIGVREDIPAVEYEIIDELYLDENRVSILGQAFTRTGNGAEFEEIFATSLLCEEDPDIIVFEPEDCGHTGGGTGGTTTINDCGCEIFVEQRKPGGCLRVDDVQLANPGQTENFAGVRRAKVFAKDSWFTIRETFTDDNGCWKINRNYSGKAWINFRFKNDDRNKIRSEFFDFISTTSAVKVSTGAIAGPNFHDIQLNLFRQGTFTNFTGIAFIDELIRKKEHEIWAAATVNNAIHEFHDFAAAEGISVPPRLNVLILEKQRFGFASMLRQIGEGTFLNAVTNGFANSTSASNTEQFFATHLGFPITTILAPISYPVLRAYVGDVTIGVDFVNSDLLKRISYHELAHASHYVQVGENYWVDVIEATVAEGGHGTSTSTNAPLLALVESWPEHVALSLMTQNYPSTALVTAANTNFGTWENKLEEVRNESQDHVPIGLYNDLIDANANFVEFVRNENDPPFVSETLQDAVNGYTNTQLFSFLTVGVRSINDFQQLVRNDPSGNFVGDIDLLFSDY
ncbi:MAG: hypothetical protein AAFO03_14390 [Bacteroidota bacterium]